MFDVCVLLSGCGMYDGSEPQETVLLLAALERRGGRTICVAPGADQLHVVNHLDGNETEGRRRVAEESARLSRGKIAVLEDFHPGTSDALAIPGGYGVAKNLMTGFAALGRIPEVLPPVRELVGHFLAEHKPIGVVSLGKLLLEAVVEDAHTARLREERADQVYVDEGRRLLYTPGYLAGDRLAQIQPGIEALAERLLGMCAEEPA